MGRGFFLIFVLILMRKGLKYGSPERLEEKCEQFHFPSTHTKLKMAFPNYFFFLASQGFHAKDGRLEAHKDARWTKSWGKTTTKMQTNSAREHLQDAARCCDAFWMEEATLTDTLAFFTKDTLTWHCTKSTGGTNQINDGWIYPPQSHDPGFVQAGSLPYCNVLLRHLNSTEPLLMLLVVNSCAFHTVTSQSCEKGIVLGWIKPGVRSCVIPGDRRMVMGNVKLLSSVAEGSVEGSMQYLTHGPKTFKMYSFIKRLLSFWFNIDAY